MEMNLKIHGPGEAPQETELGTYGVEYAVAVPAGEAVNWMIADYYPDEGESGLFVSKESGAYVERKDCAVWIELPLGRWCKYCDNAIDMEDGTWRCTKHTVIDEDLNDEYMQEVEEYGTCELWEECSDE